MKPDEKTLSEFAIARELEWIETNGLGGYASGTVSGAHSRRYHGLLVAALHPPVGRTVLLSKLEESILVKNDGEQRFDLSANQYPGTVHPQGYSYLQKFERDLFPVFYFQAGGVVLKKTIAAVHGENTTLVLYEVVEAGSAFTLSLLPLASSRDYHSLSHANDQMSDQYLFDSGVFRTLNYQGGAELFISVPKSKFKEQHGWYYNFEYAVEQYRGLDFQEDLYTHGQFIVDLKAGDTLGIIISTENPLGRDAFALFAVEKMRREHLLDAHGGNSQLRRLVFAADQFIVKRGNLSTIIAGYHWFADWGRDTMIALPGLCLATGRYAEAKQILQEFAESVSEGMLPNRFPDGGESPEYNTIDATLWFFLAIHQYYEHTADNDFMQWILPVLKDIIDWHYRGTRYGIKVDSDELLMGGQDGVQLTWMDARVGDWVVTPRKGKPVEINALWYNALCTMEKFTRVFGDENEANLYQERAGRVFDSFNAKFWSAEEGYLHDYIDGDYRDHNLRPNQIYAVSLPFPLLSQDRAEKVVDIVSRELLTARGLRSLGRSHTEYKAHYGGSVWQRDSSYHQGTVWSFLLGPFVDALVRTKGEKGKAIATGVLRSFLEHLDEAAVGTIAEIFDADEPHTPRGCMAQAWGVGEVLRVALAHNLLTQKDGTEQTEIPSLEKSGVKRKKKASWLSLQNESHIL